MSCHSFFRTRSENSLSGMSDQGSNHFSCNYPRGSKFTAIIEPGQSTEEPTVQGAAGPSAANIVPAMADNESNEEILTHDNSEVNNSAQGAEDEETTAADSEVEEIVLHEPGEAEEAIEVIDVGDPVPAVEQEAAEGRPPQRQSPRLPRAVTRLWTRIRARLTRWRHACHPNCGRVCANRRRM